LQVWFSYDVMETGYNDYQTGRDRQVEVDGYYRKVPKFNAYNKTITYNIIPLDQI